MAFEVRSISGIGETSNAAKKIAGYWSVFNNRTIPIDGWFQEVMLPGAFAQSLSENTIKCLYQHNPENLLASTRSGTFTLKEDSHGLYGEAVPPDTALGRDVSTLMARGDLNEASIGFYYRMEGKGSSQKLAIEWQQAAKGEQYDIIKVKSANLQECSVVNFPRNEAASLGLRSSMLPAEIEEKPLVLRALNRFKQELDPTDDDRAILTQYRSALDAIPSEELKELLKRAAIPAQKLIIPVETWVNYLDSHES